MSLWLLFIFSSFYQNFNVVTVFKVVCLNVNFDCHVILLHLLVFFFFVSSYLKRIERW